MWWDSGQFSAFSSNPNCLQLVELLYQQSKLCAVLRKLKLPHMQKVMKTVKLLMPVTLRKHFELAFAETVNLELVRPTPLLAFYEVLRPWAIQDKFVYFNCRKPKRNSIRYEYLLKHFLRFKTTCFNYDGI